MIPKVLEVEGFDVTCNQENSNPQMRSQQLQSINMDVGGAGMAS